MAMSLDEKTQKTLYWKTGHMAPSTEILWKQIYYNIYKYI